MTGDRGFSLIEVLVVLVLIGCLAAITTYQVMKTDGHYEYDRTITIMEDIRKAVLGRQDLYCNGQRQFSGYVADMGALPALVDQDGEEELDNNNNNLVTGIEGEQTLIFLQPRALWTRDINGNGNTDDPFDIPESLCWKYNENERIWAGWHGPYITPPEDGILKDGWGNPLLFSDGEIITLQDETVVEYTYSSYVNKFGITVWSWATAQTMPPGTYRCKTNWAFPPGPGSTNIIKNPLPGFGTPYSNSRAYLPTPYNNNWDDCWEALPEALAPVIESMENLEDPDEYRSVATNLFYGSGTLCVISFGADGKPGGSGYDRDISMTIYPSEYTGEVAGMVGNAGQDFADYVSICYPKYEQGKSSLLEWRHRIPVASMLTTGSEDGCKNFRYGTAPLSGSLTTPDNEWNVNIPVGIRSIKAEVNGPEENDSIYVFPVEPTGNFIGTIIANKPDTQNNPGDIDGDSDVDQDDYDDFMDSLGSSEGDDNYNPAADLDNDEDVDLYDYYLFKKNFNQGE